jgi:membrane protease YdiL (CAAX protease family)
MAMAPPGRTLVPSITFNRLEATTMTTHDATRTHPMTDTTLLPVERSSTRQLWSAAWFIGLSLALAVLAVVVGAPAALVPFVLALGPAVIAVALAWREGDGALRRLGHSLTIRPAQARWYLVLLIPVAWALGTVAIAVALGEPTADLFGTLFPAMLIIPLVVLLPAVAEELAWRGFALPRLLTAMSPLQAALVIAVPWTLLHVVLFLPGQWYEDLALWPLVVSIVSYSILLTWVYVRTGGSVLMTALFHAGLNAMAPLMAGLDPDTSWVIRNLLAGAIALAVVALGGLRVDYGNGRQA